MKTVMKTVEPADRQAKFDHIRPLYLDALTLVERLHRRLLDVIKDEFDRRGRSDINSVQALLLYNIGDKELTAGELRTRGYYEARADVSFEYTPAGDVDVTGEASVDVGAEQGGFVTPCGESERIGAECGGVEL